MSLVDYKNAIHFGDGYEYESDFTDETEKSLGTIYLTGGGLYRRPFKGTGVDSKYGWSEMVWYKTPSRGMDFSFKLDNIDVGLVARCEVNIKYMNQHDYMDLRRIVGRERYFKAKFFDIDSGKWVEREMYCTESTYGKLYTLNESLIGEMDLSLKFVGTNTDSEVASLYTITYNMQGFGTQIPTQTDIGWGDQATINTPSAVNGKTFIGWSLTPNSTEINYGGSQKTTVWDNITLYAIWEDA